MQGTIWVIIKKEIIDAIRDNKSLSTALIMPIVFSLILYGGLTVGANLQDASRSFDIAVKGGDNARPLMDWLNESGINTLNFDGDPIEAINAQEHQFILQIPDNFNSDFRNFKITKLYLYSDHSNTKSQSQLGHLKYRLNQWSNTNGTLRLLARNINPELMHAYTLEDINISNPQRVAIKILGGFPMLLIILAFMSGLGMSNDIAAGERERKSLEPLMINPISEATLFFGKLGATVAITFALVVIGVVMEFAAVYAAPLADMGVRIAFSITDIVLIILILLPVILLAGSLQILVSFFAKSFKDAQSYGSLMAVLPMIPGLYLIFNSSTSTLPKMLIPIAGPQLLVTDVISGEPISLLNFMVAASTSICLTLLATYLGVKQLKRETIF